MTHRRFRGHDRRGATLVEFAIVAPIFFMVSLAVVEFGWAIMAESVLTNAAHAGARAAVLNGAELADVTTAVNSYLSSFGLPNITPSVSPDPPSNAKAGEYVTVTVNIPYSQISLLPVSRWLKNATLTSKAMMRRETSQ